MADLTVAKFVAITTPFLMTGFGIKASSTSVPILYDQQPAVALHVFAQIFHRGSDILAPAAILTATASGYLAYRLPLQRRLWLASAASVLSIGLVTKVFMMDGIQRLLDLAVAGEAQQRAAQSSGEVLGLLVQWTKQNWIRVVLNGTSGLIALWASLTNVH